VRIAFLTSGLTGYLDAELCALADLGAEMLVVADEGRDNVAYRDFRIIDRADYWGWSGAPDEAALRAKVDAFAPQAILMHSWERPQYRAVMKQHAGSAVRLLWMDNNWLGTPKQWVGRLTSRRYLHPVFDAAFVPGERTEAFARRLGFAAADVIRGSLTADTALYDHAPVDGAELAVRARFVAALRMVDHKGPDVLATAYRRYRDLVETPWELDIVGVGPMQHTLEGIPGVNLHGFVQPPDVAALFHRSSCCINPARAEPFGVVLHEAAAAALPIITSEFVGAAPYFVQDGVNGWFVESGRADLLADAMALMSDSSTDALSRMSRVSQALSTRTSPASWARNLLEELNRRTG